MRSGGLGKNEIFNKSEHSINGGSIMPRGMQGVLMQVFKVEDLICIFF